MYRVDNDGGRKMEKEIKEKKRGSSCNQDHSLWLIRVALESEMFCHKKQPPSPQADFRLSEQANAILHIFLQASSHMWSGIRCSSLFSCLVPI